MPNWVNNNIIIKGKNELIEQFLSDAQKDQNGHLSFSSWIPIPETFLKYDTTNFPNGKWLKVGETIPFAKEGSPLVTEELIEEYIAATKLQKEQYGVVGLLDFNCKTFGCKWDCQLDVDSKTDGELSLYCETPWSPPLIFLKTISVRYPELSFIVTSDSVENGYYLQYTIERGVTIIKRDAEYEYDDDQGELIMIENKDTVGKLLGIDIEITGVGSSYEKLFVDFLEQCDDLPI